MAQLKNTKRRIVLKSLKSFGFRLVANNGRHAANHLVRRQLSIAFPTRKHFSVAFIRELLNESNISENVMEDS